MKKISREVNDYKFGGYTDWRLPSIDELYTQFQVNLGQVAGLTIDISHNSNLTIRYLRPIKNQFNFNRGL